MTVLISQRNKERNNVEFFRPCVYSDDDAILTMTCLWPRRVQQLATEGVQDHAVGGWNEGSDHPTQQEVSA